jgi:hypothetical protein
LQFRLNHYKIRGGGELGNVLLIVIDVKAMEAVVNIGDEDLLDQFQEPHTRSAELVEGPQ